jgi:DNA-3-methyladenine glycosylase
MKIPPAKAQLPRSFYDRPTIEVARELLGKALLRRMGREWIGGLIVETEAYLAEGDPASHSARGRTPSNASMFGPPGTLYVYPIHGKHCMNAVTEKRGIGSAVLIRALEPIWGIDWMRNRRGRDDLRGLTRGPAMLCQALGIDRDDDGTDLIRNRRIRIATLADPPSSEIHCSRRIGISKAVEHHCRFFLRHNRFVSGPLRDHA